MAYFSFVKGLLFKNSGFLIKEDVSANALILRDGNKNELLIKPNDLRRFLLSKKIFDGVIMLSL